jgi:prefoldin beta subunit
MAKHNNSEEHNENCEHEHSHNPLANLDEETQAKIQEVQIMEQNLQQLLMQKQAFQMELNETDFALEELKTAEGEVFKIVGGQVIIKSSREKLQKELEHKKELINLRLKNIDKQEEEFAGYVEKLREEIIKKIQG